MNKYVLALLAVGQLLAIARSEDDPGPRDSLEAKFQTEGLLDRAARQGLGRNSHDDAH
jgi:hypothetical protein